MLLNNCHKLSALWNDTDLDIRRARRLVRLDLPGSRSCGSGSFSLFAHDSVVPVPMPDRTAWYDESGGAADHCPLAASPMTINLLTRYRPLYLVRHSPFYLPLPICHAVAPATVCCRCVPVWVQSTRRTAAARLESLGERCFQALVPLLYDAVGLRTFYGIDKSLRNTCCRINKLE